MSNLSSRDKITTNIQNPVSDIQHPVILFDGVCNLCNRSVNFVIRFDKKRVFRFAALQSTVGKSLVELFNIDKNIDSLILVKETNVYLESDAVLQIARSLTFPFSLATVFFIIPKKLRDRIYRWIARNRYRWFGKRETCRLPMKGEEELFMN